MPFKDPTKRLEYAREYHEKYYKEHHDERLEYRKSRRAEDRELWRQWAVRKKNTERKNKMRAGMIYKPKKNLISF